ncbi:amidohydrolase family protein [Amycolatopsis sp. GM8]|uniref:amidohydrolase family protein n=1 Tax=Amycolatopsis sp. GM8 TaxID=2896530 RepID=UPI001F3509CE|nr:amidohydrolase family protein [Amycolatopsis sp. GM8]
MTYKPRQSGPFAGLKLIDADTHVTEAEDLWTSRAPAKYADRVPQTRTDTDGQSYWFVDGDKKLSRNNSIAFVNKAGEKIPYYGADMQEYDRDKSQIGGSKDEIHAAAVEAKPRVELMDEMGVYAQIVYPNIMGFAAPAMVQNLDRDLSYVICQIYNDAMREWQAEGDERLLPQAMLPFWDIEQSVAEAKRAKDIGLTGVLMAGEPHQGGLPDLGTEHWYPLYEVLSDLELPINIHIGARNWKGEQGGAAWPSLPERAAKPVRSIQTELSNSRFVSNLCASDVLIRYPKLNWVSVESGIGWIPYILERIDYEYREEFPGGSDPELPPAKEMFGKGVFGTFWFEDAGPLALLDRIGADNVLWETDFPHPTSLYPSPVERSEEKLYGLPPHIIRKIVQDNAAKLYKIDV